MFIYDRRNLHAIYMKDLNDSTKDTKFVIIQNKQDLKAERNEIYRIDATERMRIAVNSKDSAEMIYYSDVRPSVFKIRHDGEGRVRAVRE